MEFTKEQIKEIEKIADRRIEFNLPKLLGRTLRQLREYFISQIN
jgi:hypothetical protein